MGQRVGTPPRRRQEWPLQVGPQQLAAARPVGRPRFTQHRQGLAQRRHGAGHQGGTDRFHPIAPEQLQQLQQPRQVSGGEFGEGQAEAAVDLQVHAGGAEPVPLPVAAGGPAAGRQRLEGGDAAPAVDRHPPAPVGLFRQAQVGQPGVALPIRRGRIVAGGLHGGRLGRENDILVAPVPWLSPTPPPRRRALRHAIRPPRRWP